MRWIGLCITLSFVNAQCDPSFQHSHRVHQSIDAIVQLLDSDDTDALQRASTVLSVLIPNAYFETREEMRLALTNITCAPFLDAVEHWAISRFAACSSFWTASNCANSLDSFKEVLNVLYPEPNDCIEEWFETLFLEEFEGAWFDTSSFSSMIKHLDPRPGVVSMLRCLDEDDDPSFRRAVRQRLVLPSVVWLFLGICFVAILGIGLSSFQT